MFRVFTKRVHKLKQCTNSQINILHDENYRSFVVSLLIQKMGEWEGVLIQEDVLILIFSQ